MTRIQIRKNQPTNLQSGSLYKIYFGLLFVFCLVISAAPISAQINEEPPDDVAPPAMKLLSKIEKESLEAQDKNIKKRTKVSLELMEARLLKAEKSLNEERYSLTLKELAGFNAILDNSLEYLLKTDNGKSDRHFISFEIYLRKQVPRLESIRREMPSRFGYYVGKLMISVREARSKAVEPIYGETLSPNASKKP